MIKESKFFPNKHVGSVYFCVRYNCRPFIDESSFDFDVVTCQELIFGDSEAQRGGLFIKERRAFVLRPTGNENEPKFLHEAYCPL